MFHKEVLMRFKKLCKVNDEDIKEWFPNGKNSVRVELKNGFQYVLTFHSIKDWCLETRVSYENRLSEKAKLMRKAGKS